MKYLLFIILLIVANTATSAKWDYYNDSNSIIKGGASSIVVDYNNIVWVSTGDGLVSIDGSNWTKYDSTDSDYIKYATDLTIDNYGKLWFVSNGRVVKYEDSKFVKIDSLYGAKFIEFDSENSYWVANNESIYKKEGNEFIEKYKSDSVENNAVSLTIKGNENVYFSRLFYSDLCLLQDDGTKLCFDKNNSEIPEPYSITSFATDSSGSIWTGGRSLIQGFDGEKWKVYDSLKTNDNNIGMKYRALCFDKNNILWALSNPHISGNIYLFRIGENVESYTIDTNFVDPEKFNIIFDLAIDFNGNVWIASTMGLFKFTPELTNIDNQYSNNSNIDITYEENNIEITSQEMLTNIEIFDLMGGNVIAKSDINALEYTLETSELVKGLYILRVNNISYKFLKR